MAESPTSGAVWEGIFHLEAIRKLHLEPNWPAEELYRFLTLQLRRDPTDPALHAGRFLLALGRGWHDRLYGILLDLCYGLDRKGRGLQRLLFEMVSGELPPQKRERMAAYLAGELSLSELPWGEFSVLHPGTVGKCGGGFTPPSPPLEERDPLLIARLCLEAGQLEEAIELLREALREHPERDDLRQELSELEQYLPTQNR